MANTMHTDDSALLDSILSGMADSAEFKFGAGEFRAVRQGWMIWIEASYAGAWHPYKFHSVRVHQSPCRFSIERAAESALRGTWGR